MFGFHWLHGRRNQIENAEIIEVDLNEFEMPLYGIDREKEEVLVLEEKVLAAESFVLETLDYDIFWRGFDWIRRAGEVPNLP